MYESGETPLPKSDRLTGGSLDDEYLRCVANIPLKHRYVRTNKKEVIDTSGSGHLPHLLLIEYAVLFVLTKNPPKNTSGVTTERLWHRRRNRTGDRSTGADREVVLLLEKGGSFI
jgi:hypothetical protein